MHYCLLDGGLRAGQLTLRMGLAGRRLIQEEQLQLSLPPALLGRFSSGSLSLLLLLPPPGCLVRACPLPLLAWLLLFSTLHQVRSSVYLARQAHLSVACMQWPLTL